MRSHLVFILALVLLASGPPRSATASPPTPIRLVDTPCAGCRAVLPVSNDAVPLIVVLHGDYGAGPTELLRAWEPHALRHGVGVLALECPRDQGCKGSWWRWNGSPSWVSSQVESLASKHAI